MSFTYENAKEHAARSWADRPLREPTCDECEKIFRTKSFNARFCSPYCRLRAFRKTKR
jgi:hypothetical protein